MVKQKVFEEVFKNMIRIQIDDVLTHHDYNVASIENFQCVFTLDTSDGIESMFIDFEGVFYSRPLCHLFEDQFRFNGYINRFTGAVNVTCVYNVTDSEVIQ